MDAIILAGGLGTRLKATVTHVPKPLAPVAGRPFLDFILEKLSQMEGLTRVILALGHGAMQIVEYYQNAYFPFEITFSIENIPLGTGGALKKALSQAKSDLVLVSNGDSFLNLSLDKFYHYHLSNHADLTLAALYMENAARFGSLLLEERTKRILKFEEKIIQGGWINGGIYLLRKNLLDAITQEIFSLEKDAFPQLLNNRVFAYPCTEKFIDIGTKESYFQAQSFF